MTQAAAATSAAARWLRQVAPNTLAVCEGQRVTVGAVEMVYGKVGLLRLRADRPD